MTRKLALLAVLGAAACAPAVPEAPSPKQIHIRVEAAPTAKFDKVKAAAKAVADKACAIGQQASWVATTSEPGTTVSRFIFVCN